MRFQMGRDRTQHGNPIILVRDEIVCESEMLPLHCLQLAVRVVTERL
ncbi:MAG: hypothetical protein RMY34_25480 [Aulosira sp. DedQUE10]|nr:hypothetical protein [Aulosira sp. DedQUE10]